MQGVQKVCAVCHVRAGEETLTTAHQKHGLLRICVGSAYYLYLKYKVNA